MADITVTRKNVCSVGNVTRVTASCASVATGATWPTGLSRVDQLFMNPDLGKTWSWTQSGGTVTFTISAGPINTVSLEAVGAP